MEWALLIVGKIVEKIIDYTIAPIGHQLGYLIHYGRNIDELRVQISNLEEVKNGINFRVDPAKRNGDVIRQNVNDWIEKADNIARESEHLLDHEVNGNQRCSFRSCPNLVSRYKVSRKVNKKKMVVDELISSGNKFDRVPVSDPAPPPPIRSIYSSEDTKDFESRNSIINDVMEAIKDDKYNIIGVHGMGGIGKTTLVKKVAKKAEDDKLFEVITPIVAVSQTPDIMKIQHEIADRLGLKFEEKESGPTRVGRLNDRIMKETKSILVILDDLWAELNLEDIGIPRPSVHKGCKILLTTRNQHVCTQMGSQKDIPIKVLSKEEAWKLFQEKAGDIVDSPDLLPIATEVAKECAGLPLAIVTVAGALMKIKELSVWRDVLRRLQNPSSKNIGGMTAAIYSSLQLSYDFLDTEEVKNCLLLCCLAPEDSDIRVSELVRFGMGLRLFSDVRTFDQVRDAVRASIDKLKTRSLLLDGNINSIECVKMHDMVRDFAISIASESKRGIWARIDFGRSEWSNDLNCNETTIALHNSFHQIPAQIDCPKLNLLVLEKFYGGSSKVLPEKLFNGTTELRVLSMVDTTNPTVPIALFQSLVNLQTLCLEGCEIEDLPCIADLKCLEILSLSRSKITELPREIEQLTRLRILDLSNCYELERIPAGVLSRLSQLEGLYMGHCAFNKWGEDDSASLDELKGLSSLRDLHMQLNNAEHFPQDIQLPRLSEFQFNLGRMNWDEVNYHDEVKYFPKTLGVYGYEYDGHKGSIASHKGVKMLLNMAEYLILKNMEDLECFLSDIKRDGFSTLKRLNIVGDSTVEYLANTTTTTTAKEGVMILPQHKVFPVLERLDLYKMSNLKEICHGQLPIGSFCELHHLTLCYLHSLEELWVVGNNNASLPNLKGVNVRDCPKLKTLINICSQNIANGFGQQLHEISVENCKNLEEIFTYDDDVGVEEETNEILLPKLRILKLKAQLPNLATFCSKRSTRGILQQTFFPEKIIFPQLQTLNVSGNFEQIWSPRVEIHIEENFRILRVLNIQGCQKLKKAIPYNLAKYLHALEDLTVKNCDLVEEVVEEVGKSVRGEEILFPHLRKVKIDNCGGLRHLFKFNHLKELKISNCKMMKEIFLQESAEEDKSSFLQFPQLDSLRLFHLQELTCFYHGLYSLEFPSLKNLTIEMCPKMETVAFNDKVMVNSLLNETIVFSNLNKLVVSGSFEEIWPPQIPDNSFCRLTDLEINGCDKLKISIPSNMVQILRNNLKRFVIRECKMMKEIVANTELGGADQEEAQLHSSSLTYSHHGSSVLEFPSLEELSIKNCPKIETFVARIVEGNPDVTAQVLFNKKIVFSNLNKLVVSGSFEEIWPPQIPDNSFCRLKYLEINGCDKLKIAIPSNMVQMLRNNLKRFVIRECKMMKEIVANTELGGADQEEEQLHSSSLTYSHHGSSVFEFPSLVKLLIQNCPKIETFVARIVEGNPDDTAQVLFNEKVLLPALVTLEIVGLKCVKETWCKQFPAKSFSQLQYLTVTSCDCLRNLLTPSIVKALSSLETIEIKECSTLEEVLVDAKEEVLVQVSDDHVQDKVIVFPHLYWLNIVSLPNFRSFYSGSLTLEFPSLKYFYFGDCPQMQTFSPGLVVTPKLHSVSKKGGPEYDYKGDLNSTIQHLFQEKEN